MKSLICYKTKSGSTKKYMDWLAESIGADIKTFGEIPRRYDFSGYDAIVVSSGTYASFMPLNRFLKKHWKKLAGKKIFVVAVGGLSADDPWSKRSYNRIPEKIRQSIAYYKIMGEQPEQSRPENYVSLVSRNNLNTIIADIKEVDN